MAEPLDSQELRHRLSNWLQPLALRIWLALLLVLPTLVILVLSLVPGFRPGDVVNPSGLDNYVRVFEPIYLQVIGRSLFFAVGTTVICLLNTVLTSLGLPALELLNSSRAVLIGMSYSLLPYMVLILYASLEKLDRRLLEAAADLGANPVQTFWKVTVPQTLSGIAAGSILVFITGLGDFVDPELLGGASSMTVARLIYNQFLGATQNWGFGSALSMVLILAVSIAIALLIKFGNATLQR